MYGRISLLSLLLAAACASEGAERKPAVEGPPPPPAFDAETFGWQPSTRSPQLAAEEPDAKVAALPAECEVHDGALDRVATALARASTPERLLPNDDALVYTLRREGAPYVWSNAWVLSGHGAKEGASQRLGDWLKTQAKVGERRCGLGSIDNGPSGELVVAIVDDVLADLEALPTVVGVGTWLDLRAKLLVPAYEAKVFLLGPRGLPHSVPTSFDQGNVRARFRVDQAGVWMVQVLAVVRGGPRPVAEAVINADVEPAREFTSQPVPGEERLVPGGDEGESLFDMVNGARVAEGVRPLQRHALLDALAREHVDAMKASGRLAHDVGDGDPSIRLRTRGLDAAAAGENVAHGADLTRAHRALFHSVSHRENMLNERYDALGLGVARDTDGTVWVCEIFAQLR